MSVAAERSVTAGGGAPAIEPADHSRPFTVLMAVIGAAAVAFFVWIFTAWGLSGPEQVTIGRDVDTASKYWVRFFEVLSVTAGAYFVVRLVRQCRRERRITVDAAIALAFVTTYWQDPGINYYRTGLLYNSNWVNLRNWVDWVPGWMNPAGGRLGEPVLGIGIIYIWLGLAWVLAVCAMVRRAHQRWPHLSRWQLFGVALFWGMVFDFVMEYWAVRTHAYHYAGVIDFLSLHAGKDYQFPLYELPLWGGFGIAAIACLRYFTDDRGRTVFERGAERVRSKGRVGLVRTLAFVGFVNVSFFTYNVISANLVLLSNSFPEQPAYMRTDMIGPDSPFPYPQPGDPIPVKQR